jgi:hypothetical protein
VIDASNASDNKGKRLTLSDNVTTVVKPVLFVQERFTEMDAGMNIVAIL